MMRKLSAAWAAPVAAAKVAARAASARRRQIEVRFITSPLDAGRAMGSILARTLRKPVSNPTKPGDAASRNDERRYAITRTGAFFLARNFMPPDEAFDPAPTMKSTATAPSAHARHPRHPQPRRLALRGHRRRPAV